MANEEDDKDWCSINKAARRLRVTPTAIHNWIKRSTLKTKPNGNFGRLVYVPFTMSPTVPTTDPGTVIPTVDSLVPELRAQIGQLEERLKATQDELVAMAQKVGATAGQ